jgi:hypothetical protein
MAVSALLSTVAAALFLLVVVATVSLAGRRREVERPRLDDGSLLSVLTGPVGWGIGFLLATAVVGTGVVVVVSDGGFLPGLGGEFLPGVLFALGVLLALGVAAVTYHSVRARGGERSLAAIVSILLLAFALLGGVASQLEASLDSLGTVGIVTTVSVLSIAGIAALLKVVPVALRRAG